MYFLILSLDPSELVDHLITPLIHALIPNMHLRIQNPQKAEALLRKCLHRDIHDLRIGHRAVVQVELIVGEHERCVIPLSSLYSPGWVDLDDLKVTQLVHNVL